MSLRARLLIGLVALVSIGLLIADVITFASLRAFLYQRVDQQIVAAVETVSDQLEFRPGPRRPPPRGSIGYLFGTYWQLRDDGGDVLRDGTLGETGTPPTLPARLEPESAFNTRAADRSVRYRVSTAPVELVTGDPGMIVVAVPLREVDVTMRRLIAIELLVTLIVVGSVGVLAWWVVRLGLRPLEEMGATASEIAAGDLSRRVERADERTEVGRLGLALNAMLTRIEQAFAERKESEDKLRRFLADASHELRTPLTSIRGYAELFRRGADTRPDDLAKSMDRIEQESARMGVLVDDLLLLARLDQGPSIERTDVDLAALAADAVADARAIDPEREITLEAPGRVMLQGDEVRLRQVTANLMSNALTHTPAGTPVEVRVVVQDSVVTLSVTDHGPGLEAEDAARVFERFYRSDPSRARESGGAGLGLSIVSAIAHAHGGTVAVDTTPGAGATFRVTLPVS